MPPQANPTGTTGNQPVVPVLLPALAILLSLTGLTLTAVLTLSHLDPAHLSGLCSAGGCQQILSSPFAHLGPIPTASLGLAFYTLTLLTWSAAIATSSGHLRRAAFTTLLITSTLAALASLALMFIQFAILRGFCPLCTLSALLCLTLCLLSFKLRRRTWPPQPIAWTLLAVPPLAATIIFALRPTPPQDKTTPVMEVAGRTFTHADMLADLRDTLAASEWDAHRAKLDWADRQAALLILSKEAQANNTTPDQLLTRTIESRTRDAETSVDEYLRTNPPPPGRDPASARAQILSHLRDQATTRYLEELKTKYNYKLHLMAPTPRESDLDPDQLGHRLGPEDAPARLVVFSDFQCPGCADLAQSLHAARDQFGDRLSITYLHLPLPNHALATDAAVIAEWAAARSAFWPVHDALMSHKGALDEPALIAAARAANIDPATLSACRSDPDLRSRVARHARHAAAIGLTSTPALFLNGRRIGGTLSSAELSSHVTRVFNERPRP